MTTAQETPEEGRLARMEVTVDYLVRDLGDIRAELRLQREDMSQQALATQQALESIRQESRKDFRWMVGTAVGLMIPTWGLLAGVLFKML